MKDIADYILSYIRVCMCKTISAVEACDRDDGSQICTLGTVRSVSENGWGSIRKGMEHRYANTQDYELSGKSSHLDLQICT